MATCKDCAKYDACLAYNGGTTRTISMKNKAEEMCGHFKDRTRYVEVTRCRDCGNYCKNTGECNMYGHHPGKDGYCSNAIPKEREE